MNRIIKNGIIVLLCYLLCKCMLLASETADIETELTQNISPANKISNGRYLILENIKSGNIEKANKIYNYFLNNIEKNTCPIFSANEILELNILLKKYDIVCSTNIWEKIEQLNVNPYGRDIVFTSDNLEKQLINIIKDNKNTIISETKDILGQEEWDYLKIKIDLMIPVTYDKKTEKEIKKRIKLFNKKYPKNEYKLYLPDFNDNGKGFYYGFAFANIYEQWGIVLGCDINDGQVFGNFEANIPSCFNMNIGYSLINNKHISVYPFIGQNFYSTTIINQNDPKYFNYYDSTTYGIVFDIPLFHINNIYSKLRFKYYNEDLSGLLGHYLITVQNFRLSIFNYFRGLSNQPR